MDDKQMTSNWQEFRGLTTLEIFAGMAMQGLLANRGLAFPPEKTAADAIQVAKALQAQLATEPNN
jgi:hypothetical protein